MSTGLVGTVLDVILFCSSLGRQMEFTFIILFWSMEEPWNPIISGPRSLSLVVSYATRDLGIASFLKGWRPWDEGMLDLFTPKRE